MINQLCVLCGKNSFKILYRENFDIKKIDSRIFSARRLPDRIHYRMIRCKNDGLVYSNPILEYEKIEKLYKKSFTTYDEHLKNLQETYGFYLRELNKYRKGSKISFLSDIGRPSPKGEEGSHLSEKNGIENLKLLEIGCGNGFFFEEAKRQGYDVYGVEPGKKSVEKAKKDIRKNIIVDIFKPCQFKKNFFDVICCFQTFDHVSNPNELLAESYKILKKGGFMLFLNHDVGAWQNRLMGEKSPIIDIEHTYLFDKKTMRNIFMKHGFKVLEVKSSFNIHHLEYWVQLFPLPNKFKLSIMKFLKLVHLDKVKIKLNPGNLVLIAKK